MNFLVVGYNATDFAENRGEKEITVIQNYSHERLTFR